MRSSSSVALLSASIAVAAIVACSGPPLANDLQGQEGNGTQTAPTSPTAPTGGGGAAQPKNATCIGKVGFTYDDGGECDKCMSDQDGCCQKVMACFKDDPSCAALQKCVDDCSGTGGGGGGGPGQAVFVNEVYPSVNPTCGTPCHATGTGGAPIFFGADAVATYTQFKARGYQNGAFLNKGAHLGPELTAPQKTLVQKWMTAETGGTGGGTGDGGGAPTGKACKDACRSQYGGSLTTWNAYQTCITTTCQAQCK